MGYGERPYPKSMAAGTTREMHKTGKTYCCCYLGSNEIPFSFSFNWVVLHNPRNFMLCENIRIRYLLAPSGKQLNLGLYILAGGRRCSCKVPVALDAAAERGSGE